MDRDKHLALQRDWFLRKNADPVWKEDRNRARADKRRNMKTRVVEYFGRKCHDCGGTWIEDCVYDFHHVDIEADNKVPSNVLHCGWETIMQELAGCVMLCSNCHRIRHFKDKYSHHAKRANKQKY